MSDNEARARDARAMLENPLFIEAIEALHSNAVNSWMKTSPGDTQERERLWVWATQATRLRAYFEGVVANARIEASRMDRNPLP